ncbi:MAG TPA: YceI family protein [Polyangia bacterium]|nr:YceI family protein [Polyangia bacterium]
MRALKLLAASFLVLSPALAQASTWDVDPAHSSVEFSVRHMMVSTVKGHFQKVKGTVELDEKDPTKSTVEVSIETASIDTREAKRDAHLKSAAFFDAAKFPAIAFKSTKVEKAGKGKFKVTGNLTMHGITKPVVLAVEGPSASIKDPYGRTVRGVMATGKLDRKDWGMTWNQALDSGGMVVSDEVKLEINAELAERAATPPAAAAVENPAAPTAEKPAAATAGAKVPAAAPAKPAKPAAAPAKPAK